MGLFKSITKALGLDLVAPGASTAQIAVDATAAPKLPDLTAAPAAPTGADTAEAQRLEREAQLRARGRASTIATSGQGDTSRPTLARRFLLGG